MLTNLRCFAETDVENEEDNDADEMDTADPPKPSSTAAVAAATEEEDDDEDADADGDDSKKKRGRRQKNSVVHQLKEKVIQITTLPNGINEQVCKYCGKSRSSKQFQTTFWTLHILNQKPNENCMGFQYECPKCPLATRRMIATMSKSPQAKAVVSGNSFFAPPTNTRAGRVIKKRKFDSEESGGGEDDDGNAANKPKAKQAKSGSSSVLPTPSSKKKKGADRSSKGSAESLDNKKRKYTTGILYEHIKIEKSEFNTNLMQFCLYCDQVKKYKQLQSEFWFKHFLAPPNSDPRKVGGCPNCPMKTRQAIFDAIKDKSANSNVVRDVVHKFEKIYGEDGFGADIMDEFDSYPKQKSSPAPTSDIPDGGRGSDDGDESAADAGPAAVRSTPTEENGDDDGANDKPSKTVLWQQVDVTRHGGVGTKYLGVCKHCNLFKREAYQLQSTQFALHYVDLTNYNYKKDKGAKKKPGRQSTSCPYCPIKIRKEIAEESNSSAVTLKAREGGLLDLPSDDDDFLRKREEEDSDSDHDQHSDKKKALPAAVASASNGGIPERQLSAQETVASSNATVATPALAPEDDGDVRMTLKAIQTQMKQLATNQAKMMENQAKMLSAITQIQSTLEFAGSGES